MSTTAVLRQNCESLEDLIQRVEPRLKKIIARYDIPPQDTEDLLQTSLIATLRNWDSLLDPEGWLIRTVVNQCLMYWRGKRRRNESNYDPPVLEHFCPPVPSPEKGIVDRRDAEQRLAQLPPLCQEILRLRFLYGFSASEVAKMLGRKVSTVYGATHRCMKQLQELRRQDEVNDAD